MDGPQAYRAFISYSHRDARWGKWIHRRLEMYRLPKAIIGRETPYGPIPERLLPIFRDRDELSAATDLSAEITGALERALFLVVICSPAAASSLWVNEEIKNFKRLHGEARVRAVIVDGVPFSDDPDTECFPVALRFCVGEDGNLTGDRTEPVAADLRSGGDGRKHAISKLVAGLTGARLDDLVQRENVRRVARMRALSASLGGLALILSGLTFDALRQRNTARLAQVEAEAQRAEAQGLVEFMLTDLRKRLDAVGRLDILDAVALRLLESFEKQDLGTLDPDTLGRRARVLMLLGEVEAARGKLDGALARYTEASAATGELLRRAPDDEHRIFDHAQSVYWVGDIALKRGEIQAATTYWDQYLDFAQRLVELDPDKDEWRTELAYGYRNLASLALDEGDAATAVVGFRKALEISRNLAEKAPADRGRQLDLADDYVWLALALERLGAFAEAEAALATEAELHAWLLSSDPADNAVLRRSAVNGRVRARLALAVGDAPRALELLKSLVPLHVSRLAHDETNTQWHAYLGWLQIELGNALLATGDHAAARTIAHEAMETAGFLMALDGAAAEWAILNYGGALMLSADVELAAGNIEAAAGNLAKAEEIVPRFSGRSDVLAANLLGVKAAVLRARIAQGADDEAAAHRIASALSTKIVSLVAKSGFESKTVFVEAFLLAGEIGRARSLAEELAACGYRHPNFMQLKAQIAASKGGESESL